MDKVVFQKDWYDAIMEDTFNDTTPQEMSYIMYAAAMYSFNGEKIDIGKVFGNEFRGLNRSMPNIYSQIDNIVSYGNDKIARNQKYDNDKIQALAAMGVTQKEICRQLGYDVSKSKALSSNPGYKSGRAQYLKNKQGI